MKAAIATSLSLAGVLVAGSAAAMVNAQVLSGSGSDDGQAVPAMASPTSPPATAEPVTTTSSETTKVAYRVGESGVVTVDSSDGTLTLVSVVPNPGWEVLSSGTGPLGEVLVRFASFGVEVRMSALLVDGSIVTDVSSGVVEVIDDDVDMDVDRDDDGDDVDRDDDGDHGTVAPPPVSVAAGFTPPAPPASPAPVTAAPSPGTTHHEDEPEDEPEHEDEPEDDGHDDDD